MMNSAVYIEQWISNFDFKDPTNLLPGQDKSEIQRSNMASPVLLMHKDPEKKGKINKIDTLKLIGKPS